MNFPNEPPVNIGPLYQSKTIKVCVPDDAVCSDGLDFAAHDSYAGDGSMVDQGAVFAATRVGASPGVPAPGPPPGGLVPGPPPGGPAQGRFRLCQCQGRPRAGQRQGCRRAD
jgi:cutinase